MAMMRVTLARGVGGARRAWPRLRPAPRPGREAGVESRIGESSDTSPLPAGIQKSSRADEEREGEGGRKGGMGGMEIIPVRMSTKVGVEVCLRKKKAGTAKRLKAEGIRATNAVAERIQG